jgi:hypothetical protein
MLATERITYWLIGMLTGVVATLALGLGPDAPDPAPHTNDEAVSRITNDTRPVVIVEEDGSIVGWGCLQGYPCDDTAHAEP